MTCENCGRLEGEHNQSLDVRMEQEFGCKQFIPSEDKCNCMGCKRQSGCLQELAMIEKNKEVK